MHVHIEEPQPSLPQVLELRPANRRVLAAEWVAWTSWAVAVGTISSLWGFTEAMPALGWGLATGLGLWAAHPTQPWGLPGVVLVVFVTSQGAPWLAVHPAWLAGGAAGALAGRMRGLPPHVCLQAALAGMAGGAGAGMAMVLLPLSPHGLLGGALIGAGTACALLPLHLTSRAVPPSPRQVRRTLAPSWQEPVLRAVRLHEQIERKCLPEETLRGLGEVACWVYRVARSLQRLERELSEVPEARFQRRMVSLEKETEKAEENGDTFLRDRRLDTLEHYRRALAQADEVRVEQERLRSLQEYGLATLEEARLGLLLTRALAGQAMPDRLGEVLRRLRTDAAEASVRRRTNREVQASACGS